MCNKKVLLFVYWHTKNAEYNKNWLVQKFSDFWYKNSYVSDIRQSKKTLDDKNRFFPSNDQLT